MSTASIAVSTAPLERQAAHKHLGSLVTYLALIGGLALARVGLAVWPPKFTNATQATYFGWSAIAILGVLGLAGIWLSLKTGFPEAWAAGISNRQRLLIPALMGAGLGVFAIVQDMLSREPNFPIALPASLFVFSGGAVIIEIVYRWLPLPLALWLISSVLLRGRRQDEVFWVLAVLLSMLEPLAQYLALRQAGVAILPVTVAVLEAYLGDVWEAYLFRRYGFLAPLALRLAYYLVWHVAGGALI